MEEKSFTLQEIKALEKRYRAQLINSLSGVKSANLIGTKNKENQTNLSIVSSVVHLGSEPALFGFIQRPTNVERHTFENIVDTGCYTLNHVNETIYRQAHQTSAKYLREESEFEETGLTPEYRKDFFAPFVSESHIKLAMILEQIIDIKLNGTKLVIGSLQHIIIPKTAIKSDGYVHLPEVNTVGVTGLDAYSKLETLSRLSYAKPDQPLSKIEL